MAAALVACAETQDVGALCPALCADQNIPTRDTTLEAFVTTLSVSPFPAQGAEGELLIAARGDSLDTRAIIRFDSLPDRYPLSILDTTSAPITTVDSSALRLRIDTTGSKVTKPVTVSLFNVDTTDADTSTAVIASLFRPDRLIGSATFAPTALTDTLQVPIDTAFLRQRITSRGRLRIGVQVTSDESAQIRVFSSATADLSPRLIFDPSKDTLTHVGSFRPFSLAPAGNDALIRDLADYTLIVQGTDPAGSVPTPGLMVIGGLPARRGYLRFDLPSHIVDSSTVVRATLTLTQSPNTRLDPGDTVVLYARPSIARGAITEPVRVAMLTGTLTDSASVTGGGNGTINIAIVRLLRRWSGVKPADQPRILILSTSGEGISPVELRVYDASNPSGLRPRLRITYVPRVDFGLP